MMKERNAPAPPGGADYFSDRLMDHHAGDPEIQRKCRLAVELAARAQAALSNEDYEAVLEAGEKAKSLVCGLALAAPMLGVIEADLAAACCSKGDFVPAERHAEKSIEYTRDVAGLEYTLGSANLTAGICRYMAKDRERGSAFFQEARRIYSAISECKQHLQVLENNERQLKELVSE